MKKPTATNQGSRRLAVSVKVVWSRACTTVERRC
jgi:hypothetical protein